MVKKKKAKRTVSQKAQKSDSYHIGLMQPDELRRLILEPTREVIQFLQSYEQFTSVIAEKRALIFSLKGHLNEIRADINELQSLLPKTKTQAEATSFKIRKELQEEQKIIKPKMPVRKKPIPEEATLEKELSEIEKKLEMLG
jgi:chromosome segregation ATPase